MCSVWTPVVYMPAEFMTCTWNHVMNTLSIYIIFAHVTAYWREQRQSIARILSRVFYRCIALMNNMLQIDSDEHVSLNDICTDSYCDDLLYTKDDFYIKLTNTKPRSKYMTKTIMCAPILTIQIKDGWKPRNKQNQTLKRGRNRVVFRLWRG